MDVKSVYNFVPAPIESEVFKPDWAEQVSHDIPFSDGESGEIELTITAKTPIFIRNGHSKADAEAENPKYLEFSNIDRGKGKEYFIPATSIKGMIRNVLEIMSFSRMKQMGDDIFGLRDMNNKQYSNSEIRNTKTGWLTQKDGRWIIQNCKSDRVRMDSIAEKFNVENFRELSAKEKYEQCNIKDFNTEYNFEFDCDIPKTGNVYNLTNNNSDKLGHLVMFGSMQSKEYEYIFQSVNTNCKYYELVSQNLVQKIQDIEKDLDKSLWKYFFDLKLKSVPVFYKLDKSGKKVIHFGFSKLYKLNNTHYLNELEPLKSYAEQEKKTKKNLEYDLANLIFGHTQGDDSLKGRVFFGHAMSKNAIAQSELNERVLGTPKPSFYPAYLVQPDNINQKGVNYNTYLDNDSVLRGFKKYPIHQNIKNGDETDNENIASQFIPLKEGAIFNCKVRYHNLRKIELGALYSAITFHNTANAFHSLGSVKPYGFGKVKVEVLNPDSSLIDALNQFEYQMNLHTNTKLSVKSNWIETKSIQELFALSQISTKATNISLIYPKLDDENEKSNQRKNQFNNVKKDNLSLKDYSNVNGHADTKSVLSNDIIQKIDNERKNIALKIAQEKLAKEKAEKEKQRIEKEKEKQRQKEEEERKRIEIEEKLRPYKEAIESADELYKKQKWQEALDLYLKAIELQTEEEYPKQQKNKCKAKLNEKEVSLDSLRELNSFDKGRSIIQQYFEKTQNISEDDKTKLKEFIFKCYVNLTSKKSIAKFLKFNKEPWKLIYSKCIDKPTAQQWYNEIKTK